MKHAVGTAEVPRTKLSGRSEARVLRGWFVGKTGLIVMLEQARGSALILDIGMLKVYGVCTYGL
jgi:hypothetical protein